MKKDDNPVLFDNRPTNVFIFKTGKVLQKFNSYICNIQTRTLLWQTIKSVL